ncbi:MAG: MBL fold metallo-hydrolase [Pyrinomonadaceae bacterium]|nr:MBL fold metallo-hydrolase [Pyrinomonadaceae bacterium]
MKVEYICHACLLIETEDLKIVTDPWFNGSAYCDQWHVFPKPVNTAALEDADVILLSHGHEDHMHEPTLQLLPKSAQVMCQYSFFGGSKEFIESLGFAEVREAVAHKKYQLSPKTSVTFLINSHDSIMVIESGGKVLVNANDALHSYPKKVIDFFIGEIKANWQNIDMLFCGFGGAGYFPNMMHLEGKDDYETGIVREQLFAHNFCHVTAELRPKVAVPFAADFALLADEQRWINHARFPRAKMSRYYQRHFGANGFQPEIYDMYPGDILETDELKKLSPYRAEMRDDGSLEHLIDEQYKEEIAALQAETSLSESEADKLSGEILQNVEKRMALYGIEKLRSLKFCLEVTDVPEQNIYNIAFVDDTPKVWRSGTSQEDALLTMRLPSKILRYSLESDWGADVVNIGYGAEIDISSARAAEVDLERICMQLLACYPTIKGTLKKAPLRSLKFMVGNSPKYTRSVKKLKQLNVESENYDRKLWLLKDPDEIRKIYELPELDAEFLS